eukprot:scaffold5.g607.t1
MSARAQVLRLFLVARATRQAQQQAEAEAEEDEEAAPAERAALPPATGPAPKQPPAAKPTKPRGEARRPPRAVKGLPPLPLPPLPPSGGSGCCSTQPVGLPMMLVGQSAARAPLYAWGGRSRLLRGLGGLAAMALLCGGVPTPFTGRRAWLPPRLVEWLFHNVVGPASAFSYLAATKGNEASSVVDRAVCERYAPLLARLYSSLRAPGEHEARALGRAVAFASSGAAIEAVERRDVNACCFPGGLVFVHSGLIRAMDGDPHSLAFVVGHEVGHAIGRHSLEKATWQYAGLFAIDIAVGLAEMLMRGGAPGPSWRSASSSSLYSAGSLASMEESESQDPMAARLRALDGALQGALYLAQLGQSRKHEGELQDGAASVMRQFMRMEAGPLGPGPAGGTADNPLSTHPAAANRLRRVIQLFG